MKIAWLFSVLALGAAFGAEPALPDSGRKAYEALFTEILGNLPKESKAKVDSAAVSRPPIQTAKSKSKSKSKGEREREAPEFQSKVLDSLPREVRERVEKAMTNLEKRKKKGLEFKELKK